MTMSRSEEWRPVPIPEFADLYQVSSDGQIKSLGHNKYHPGKILKPQKDKDGYLVVHLYKEKRKCFKIHRLVAAAFIPNPDKLPEVNHKSERKDENNVDNLEWCDGKYNTNYGTGILRQARKKYKPVAMCDLKGNVLAVINKMGAVQKLGFVRSCIYGCCNGKNKTAYGYKWKYIVKKNKYE